MFADSPKGYANLMDMTESSKGIKNNSVGIASS